MFDTNAIDSFNYGRTSANGIYAISMATDFRPYYALWRLFPGEQPLFVRTLAVTFQAALEAYFRIVMSDWNVQIILNLRIVMAVLMI